MSIADLQQAIRFIDGMATADFHGPKDEALVVQAEQALGLTFPPTYRQFLRRFGCGAVSPHELYGIVDDDFDNSSVPDAIWLTLRSRRTAQLPKSLILVSDTGDGGYYAIDRSQIAPDGESPVVEWWPGVSADAIGQFRVVASDFGAFLLDLVRRAETD